MVVSGPGTPRLCASVLDTLADLRAVAGEWDSLALASGSPFLTVAWLSAWWESFGGTPAVIAVRDPDGRLVAGVPCRRVSRTAWASPTNSESGDWGVIAADEDAGRAAWRALAGAAPGCLRLQGLVHRDGAEIALGELTLAGFRFVATSGARSPYLDLPSSYEDLLASISHDLRSQVNRRRRSLAKMGTVRLRSVRGGQGLEDALATVLRLEGSGWKTRAGTAILSDPAVHNLYRSFALRASEEGWLRLYILEVDGRPIAADYGCSFGRVGYLLKTGFDEEFQRYSPGLVLRAEVLRASIEEGLSGYDFLGGPDPYKLRWATTVRPRLGIRAYRGTRVLPEWLYWRHCRPRLRWVALHTVRRRGARPPQRTGSPRTPSEHGPRHG